MTMMTWQEVSTLKKNIHSCEKVALMTLKKGTQLSRLAKQELFQS